MLQNSCFSAFYDKLRMNCHLMSRSSPAEISQVLVEHHDVLQEVIILNIEGRVYLNLYVLSFSRVNRFVPMKIFE